MDVQTEAEATAIIAEFTRALADWQIAIERVVEHAPPTLTAEQHRHAERHHEGPTVTCPRCPGLLLRDREEGESSCLSCGWRATQPDAVRLRLDAELRRTDRKRGPSWT